ncbi:MAG: copper transporter [Actinomycetota bacterium]|nr:copper transporter [Actinomycetota bacterium]
MVNFRFHLVSLTAVFLAVAIGIAVGATVVDQATVDALKSRLDGVRERVDRTDQENARLQRELGGWTRFAQEADNEAVAGRLRDVPVLMLAVHGIERDPVEELSASLAAAEARVQGTLWFTSKLKLEKPDDAAALAAILGSTSRTSDTLRRALVTRLVAALTGAEPAGLLAALRSTAFLELEAPAGPVPDVAALAGPDTRFVVVSAPGAEVPNEELAVPLAGQLARQAGSRVLAAEPGPRQPEAGNQPAQRAVFVGQLRQDDQLAALLSTVDNVEDFRGRFAVVYALRDLAAGKVGHFGIGPGATRLVPETAA